MVKLHQRHGSYFKVNQCQSLEVALYLDADSRLFLFSETIKAWLRGSTITGPQQMTSIPASRQPAQPTGANATISIIPYTPSEAANQSQPPTNTTDQPQTASNTSVQSKRLSNIVGQTQPQCCASNQPQS